MGIELTHRVTSMENWEKKEGKVNLKCVFNPPLVGTFHTVHPAEQLDVWDQEQVHELGMSSWGGPPVPSCIQRGLALLPAAPWWDQSVLRDDLLSPILGDSGNLHTPIPAAKDGPSHHLDPISRPGNLGTPSPLGLPHHDPGVAPRTARNPWSWVWAAPSSPGDISGELCAALDTLAAESLLPGAHRG